MSPKKRKEFLIFTEVKKHLSFETHTDLVKVLVKIGVDMGRPHCSTPLAARKMAIAISEIYKKKFIQELKTSDKPFAIIGE